MNQVKKLAVSSDFINEMPDRNAIVDDFLNASYNTVIKATGSEQGTQLLFNKEGSSYDLNNVGDYIELNVANTSDNGNSSININMFGGDLCNGGYYNGKFYFRSNSVDGEDYRIWDLPLGFDKTKFNKIKLLHVIDGWELFINEISQGVKPISENAKVYCLCYSKSSDISYSYNSISIKSEQSGDLSLNAYGLILYASGDFAVKENDLGIIQLRTQVEKNSKKVDVIPKAFTDSFISSYNTHSTGSRTIFDSPITISEVGNYVELEAKYSGQSASYADKLNLLGGGRFGWYNTDSFWIRKSSTYVQWNDLEVSASDLNKIRLEVVTGGWELFLNDISQGVKAMPESGGLTFTGICNTGDSPQKYDVGKVVIKNNQTEINLNQLALNGSSENVSLVLKDGGSEKEEENPLGLYRFVKSGKSNGDDDKFEMALRDANDKSVYYVFVLSHINSTGIEGEDEMIHTNQWRVSSASLYGRSNGLLAPKGHSLLTGGESECVFKDASGVSDFTGGVHGDERIDIDENSFVRFFVDGVEISEPEETTEWTACSEFSYMQSSTMHKTAEVQKNFDTGLSSAAEEGVLTIGTDNHFYINGVDTGIVAYNNAGYLSNASGLTVSKTDIDTWAISSVIFPSDHRVVAHHIKHTVFSNQGYKTTNRLVFKEVLDMFWYHGISCISKDVASKGYNNKYNIVDLNLSEANVLKDTIGDYWAWNHENGLSAFTTSRMLDAEKDKQCEMFIWDTSGYSKYYRKFPGNGNYTSVVDEHLESEMVVKFSSKDI